MVPSMISESVVRAASREEAKRKTKRRQERRGQGIFRPLFSVRVFFHTRERCVRGEEPKADIFELTTSGQGEPRQAWSPLRVNLIRERYES